ncbi:MAG: hypothetical protein Q4G05_03015 [Clostridia bacterium]|nr:hypothetical protein [Clostridia bacterium]
MIYDAAMKANNDSNNSNSNETINFINELKINGKTLAREIINNLNDEARRMRYKPILQK